MPTFDDIFTTPIILARWAAWYRVQGQAAWQKIGDYDERFAAEFAAAMLEIWLGPMVQTCVEEVEFCQ